MEKALARLIAFVGLSAYWLLGLRSINFTPELPMMVFIYVVVCALLAVPVGFGLVFLNRLLNTI